MKFKNTLIVAGFPGVGKSNFKKNTQLEVLDSDSSTFDKSKFPENYIEHIKNNMGKVDIILVSSHKVVREAMVSVGINYALVYPERDLKNSYMDNYTKRGNTESFVKLLDENWDSWLDECSEQNGCYHIILKHDIYLSDILSELE